MYKLLLLLVTLTRAELTLNDSATAPPLIPEVPEDYKVYWNVPTYMCHKHGLHFEEVHRDYGIIQNKKDYFKNGNNIVILYDPGAFPAILNWPNGKVTWIRLINPSLLVKNIRPSFSSAVKNMIFIEGVSEQDGGAQTLTHFALLNILNNYLSFPNHPEIISSVQFRMNIFLMFFTPRLHEIKFSRLFRSLFYYRDLWLTI